MGIAGIAGMAWLSSCLAQTLLPGEEDLVAEDLMHDGMCAIDLAGERTAYLEQGAGDTVIVLLHGFGSSVRSWYTVQPVLAMAYRTIAIDLLGFGSSFRPSNLSPYDWSHQVTGVLDHLGIQRAVLVGHSMGGRAAVIIAAQCPDRVCGLCIVNSDGVENTRQWPIYRLLAHTPVPHVLLHMLQRSPRLVARALRPSFNAEFDLPRAYVEEFHRQMRVHGSIECWTHLGHYYTLDHLKKLATQIQCPTRIIWGAEDRIMPITCALQLQRYISHADVVILPHVGHIPHIEAPQLVIEQVQQFIGAHVP